MNHFCKICGNSIIKSSDIFCLKCSDEISIFEEWNNSLHYGTELHQTKTSRVEEKPKVKVCEVCNKQRAVEGKKRCSLCASKAKENADLKPNRTIYLIESSQIIQGKIIRKSYNNTYYVTIPDQNNIFNFYSYNRLMRDLGKDFFLTRNEAEEHLQKKLEQAKQNKILSEKERNIQRYREEKPKEIIKEKQLKPKKTCDACGLPIGVFGHCGCSY